MKKLKYGAKRIWENDLMRWRGYVEINGEIVMHEYLRITRKDAMKDAKNLMITLNTKNRRIK